MKSTRGLAVFFAASAAIEVRRVKVLPFLCLSPPFYPLLPFETRRSIRGRNTEAARVYRPNHRKTEADKTAGNGKGRKTKIKSPQRRKGREELCSKSK